MKFKKKGLILGIALILIISLTACGDNKEEITDKAEEEGLIIEHELGETKLEKKPEKVIVFDYGLLDIIDNLDEDVVLGFPKASLPEYLNKYDSDEYEDVGTLFEPNFEYIFELEPDLILISARQADLYDELSEIAPTVYLPIEGEKYFESFERNVETIGQILEKEDLAKEKIEEIDLESKELNEIAKDSKEKGLFLMANDGTLAAYGVTSRFGVLYNEFGVSPVDENIESSTHGQKVTFEYIVEKNPDKIYVMDRAAVAGGDISAKEVMDNELIHSTKAYQNDDIHYLDAHVWYISSGGITGTSKMIEEIRDSFN